MHQPKNLRKNDNSLSIYLDTNILQGALGRKNETDIILLNKIKEKRIKCYTSIFTIMELIDIAKDRKFLFKLIVDRWVDVNTFLYRRRRKDLTKDELNEVSKEINNFFISYNFIEIINIKEEDWDLVKEISEKSNLHSSDIIHLVTAWVGNCRYLVTHDEQFIKEGNKILEEGNVSDRIRIIKPVEFIRILNNKKI